MVGIPLSSYPDRVLTRVLGHDAGGLVGKMAVAPVPIVLTADITFYLNADTGVDSANGLTAGTPWQTPQHAVDYVASHYDLAGYIATFQFQDATAAYEHVDERILWIVSAHSTVFFKGNPTTPANVKWESSVSFKPVYRAKEQPIENAGLGRWFNALC